jgi:hypothetical protein
MECVEPKQSPVGLSKKRKTIKPKNPITVEYEITGLMKKGKYWYLQFKGYKDLEVQKAAKLPNVSECIKQLAKAHEGLLIPCDIIAFEPPKDDGCIYRVWVADNRDSKPLRYGFDLSTLISTASLKEAKSHPNKTRCRIVGARASKPSSTEIPVSNVPGGIVRIAPLRVEVEVSPVKVRHQVAGGFCALNCLANSASLPDTLYEFLYSKGPTCGLDTIQGLINDTPGTPYHLHKVKGVENTYMLQWLLRQTTGCFAVLFMTSNGYHCITWNSEEKVILETDPAFPFPVSITLPNLELLEMDKLEMCYRVVKTGGGKRQLLDEKKKRKRGF